MKILIVEDEVTNRSILEEYLKPYGDISVAENGLEAIKIYQSSLEDKKPFDLICLDIMMPELDGQGALEEIRAEENRRGITFPDGVKVVMVSAVSDNKSIFKSFRNGCEAYVLKPLNKEKLVDQIRKLGLLKKAA
jgi:two-component system chemotaxis response regulator CheY